MYVHLVWTVPTASKDRLRTHGTGVTDGAEQPRRR